jgi:hypothetical protein
MVTNISKSTQTINSFKLGLHFALRKGKTPMVDLNDVTKAGWTFLVSSQDPHVSEIIETLQPLAKHKGMNDPKMPLRFNGELPDQWFDWFQNNYYSPLSEGKRVPQYILVVGNPMLIPFRFQSLLDSAASVGRLDFDSTDQLAAYINKILSLKKRTAHRSREKQL